MSLCYQDLVQAICKPRQQTEDGIAEELATQFELEKSTGPVRVDKRTGRVRVDKRKRTGRVQVDKRKGRHDRCKGQRLLPVDKRKRQYYRNID